MNNNTLLESIKEQNALGATNIITKALKSKIVAAIQEARKQVAVEIFSGLDEGRSLNGKPITPYAGSWADTEAKRPKTGIHPLAPKDKSVKVHVREAEYQYRNIGKKKTDAERVAAKKAWDSDERMPWPKGYTGKNKEPRSEYGSAAGAVSGLGEEEEFPEIGKHPEIHHHLSSNGFTFHGDMKPQMYGPRTTYSVYTHPDKNHGFTVEKNGKWAKHSTLGRQGLLASGKGLDALKKNMGRT